MILSSDLNTKKTPAECKKCCPNAPSDTDSYQTAPGKDATGSIRAPAASKEGQGTTIEAGEFRTLRALPVNTIG